MKFADIHDRGDGGGWEVNEQQHYETVDLPFYESEIACHLPSRILDFHAHVWTRDQWLAGSDGESSADVESTSSGVSSGTRYMTTTLDYGLDHLLRDAETIFPRQQYNAVCFGRPTPMVDIQKTNSYVVDCSRTHGIYPLMVVGRDHYPKSLLNDQILRHGYLGYKVFLDWQGNDYSERTISQMLGPAEMELADDLGLTIMLHVPGADRLADPNTQAQVRDYALRYPNSRIVLAHCGRCYLPSELQRAIEAVRDLENVFLDTSMVMDPLTLRIVFEQIDSRRVLFGTDFPVAAMRGRRVYAMDHWVDLVCEGYPESDYRVASNNFRATFMAYEIIAAIRMGAELAGLSRSDTERVFYQNGVDLLTHVGDGAHIARLHQLWHGAEVSPDSVVAVDAVM